VTGAEVAELFGVGVAAGLLAGLFGVGGGILFVPALVFVGDLSQLDAVASSLAAMIPVTVVGAWRQSGYGNVRWRPALLVGALSVGGVASGTALAEALPEDVLKVLFAVLLLVTAARLLWTHRRGEAPASEI
jgi:uncharacterized membrane protein YfcA